MQTWHYWALTVVLLPAVIGGGIAFWNSASPQAGVGKVTSWVEKFHERQATSPSFWRRHVLRWLIWPWAQLQRWTLPLGNPAWQTGAMAAGYSYGVVLALVVAAALLYATLMVVVFLAGIAFSLWLLAKMLGGDESGSRTQVHTSRERTDWMGDKYIETTDEDGTVVSRSTKETGLFGDAYVQHRDAAGAKVGTSQERTGFFGDAYDEHREQDGGLTGTSREKSGFFGDQYDEHRDADGHKTGETRVERDLLGNRVARHRSSDDN